MSVNTPSSSNRRDNEKSEGVAHPIALLVGPQPVMLSLLHVCILTKSSTLHLSLLENTYTDPKQGCDYSLPSPTRSFCKYFLWQEPFSQLSPWHLWRGSHPTQRLALSATDKLAACHWRQPSKLHLYCRGASQWRCARSGYLQLQLGVSSRGHQRKCTNIHSRMTTANSTNNDRKRKEKLVWVMKEPF